MSLESHGTCLPRALPTETLPERDSRQDPIERPKTPPTSKDAAGGGSPFKRCGHLTAALTELAAAPEMAIDQGFWVGLLRIELRTSALSDQISVSRRDQEYALCISLTHHIDIHTGITPTSEGHSGHIPAQFWTVTARPKPFACRDNGASLASMRHAARDTDRSFWTTDEQGSATKPRPGGVAIPIIGPLVAPCAPASRPCPRAAYGRS